MQKSEQKTSNKANEPYIVKHKYTNNKNSIKNNEPVTQHVNERTWKNQQYKINENEPRRQIEQNDRIMKN